MNCVASYPDLFNIEKLGMGMGLGMRLGTGHAYVHVYLTEGNLI